MTSYILVLVIGVVNQTGVSLATVPGFRERTVCESAGEAWKLEAKKEYGARYYCATVPR